jgi:hypothetical protein
MTDKVNRRSVLKSVGATGLSVTVSTFSAAGHESNHTTESQSHSNADQNENENENPATGDFNLYNNSQEKKNIQVRIVTDDGDEIFSKQYVLQGQNNPSRKKGDKTFLTGKVRNAPYGTHEIIFSLPDGATSSVPIFFDKDGTSTVQAISAYIDPMGELSASLSVD